MMRLYSAGRARPLAGRLAEVLSTEPADPMSPEWLAVPSDGMRRWLMLELAGQLGSSGPDVTDGVAANIERAYPGTLRSCVLNAGNDGDGTDPWSIDRLVWSVLAAVESNDGDPGLTAFLSRPPGASRYAAARRVADLFDRYHLHRPGMIRAWAAGKQVDGTGRPLAEHAAWQPHLWELVRAEVGEPSPPERLPELLDRLRAGDLELDLPRRLIMFGFTLLPGGGFLELARAVAEQRDVHLFLLEACHLDAGRLTRGVPRPLHGGQRLRSADPTAALTDHPLVRSWGRLHRETSLLLADAQADGLTAPERVDEAVDVPPATVLGRLQRGIRKDASTTVAPAFDPSDRSVQFHACFGPVRQVEVLRDALCHLLAETSTGLTEDDVLVLCPALDRFAPLIEAAFGRSADPTGRPGGGEGATGTDSGSPRLRYRIADRSIRSTNPVLGAAAALAELVAGRFEATDVLDFISLEPVRERSGFDDEDLATIAEWVGATNVRWGLDAEHRVRFGLPRTIATNTWRAALDQLLVGTAVSDTGLMLAIGGVAPHGVEGGDVETLGRFAELVSHLGGLATAAEFPRPIAEWVEMVRHVCGAVFATARDGAWQMEALQRVFRDVLESATAAGLVSTVPLEYVDVRRLFEERLDAMVGRPDFFRGGITFTSMTPLRWIPFRVVCLLGMDQSAFAVEAAAGEDLIASSPREGDRDPRGEMRQSLLEAVLAAGDHLVVVRDGHDVRTNQKIPRAVPAAELFDSVLSTVEPDQRPAFEQHLEIEHPRHPFDERCFEVGALIGGKPWGFDRTDLEGAEARRRRTHRAEEFLARPLGQSDSTVVDLADLHAFFKNPAEAFLTQRLGARLPWSEERLSALLSVELRDLDAWRVGSRMLEARLAGVELDTWGRAERARGTLPPGVLEGQATAALDRVVESMVAAARRCGVGRGPAEPFEVEVDLADGTRIVGLVPLRLPRATPGPARITYSRTRPTHRLAAWLDLMALVGSDPTRSWRSVAIARSASSKVTVPDVVDLRPLPNEGRSRARDALAVVVDCYRRGMREPIPLFPQLSYDVYRSEVDRDRWSSRFGPGDGDHPAVRLAFDSCDVDEIMALPARVGDPPGSGNRVERFATYLWGAVDTSVEAYVPTREGRGPHQPEEAG